MEWRSLFQARAAERSTYALDVVGEIDRFDERDCIFARMDLRPGTDRYNAYYGPRPELEPVDAFLRGMPPLGSTAAPADNAILDAVFDSILHAGRPVRGSRGAGQRELLAPLEASGRLKALARYLGADLVAIGPLNPSFVYSHIGRPAYGQPWGDRIRLSHPHAISLGFAMDFDYLRRYAPGFPVILQSALAYSRAATVALQLAAYIRSLGYSARAHHLRDYQVLCVPVAVDAGLGELGRSGILITREFGTAVRLSTVTTDLPLVHDSAMDLGIQEFCGRCLLCAMSCPSGAIPRGEKTELRGVRRWKLAAGRCYHYWRTCGSDCALCVVACPWSKPDAETTPLRPHLPEPTLRPETLAEVERLRSGLPNWQRRMLGDTPVVPS